MSKYDIVLNKIKELNSNSNVDRNVLRALYDLNLENISSHEITYNGETHFTTYPNSSDSKMYRNLKNFSDILEFFKRDKFAKNSNYDDLFQEVHNRYMLDQGYDVKREIKENTNPALSSAIAYVSPNSSDLNVNYEMLNKCKDLPIEKSLTMNKDNVALMFLDTICHESQHCCQFEYATDLLLSNHKLDKEKQFVGVMALINTANAHCATQNTDIFYALKHRHNYKYQLIEHNANYCAFNKVKELINENKNFNEDTSAFMFGSSVLGLRSGNVMIPNNFSKKRMAKIEKYAKYQIEYFKKHVDTNSPFCQEILGIVDDFMKVDKNNNSMFRTCITNEIREMAYAQIHSRNEVYGNIKNNQQNQQ